MSTNPSEPTGQQPEGPDEDFNRIVKGLKACEYIRFFDNKGITIGWCNKKYLQRLISQADRIKELEAEVADLKTRSFGKSGDAIPCNQ